MQLYSVLYRVEGKLYGWETQAVSCSHAVREFHEAAGAHDVVFVDLGNRKEVQRLYKLEQSKVCDVYVWKVSVVWSGGQEFYFVGADNQGDAWNCVRAHLTEQNSLGLVLYSEKNIKQMPFYAQRYGILDLTEVEN